MQALSNGRYKSVWHRAVVNSDKERISVASFLCPCNGAVISPAMKLTGEGSPAIYRSFTYDEYYKKFWSRNLDQEHCLELFKRQLVTSTMPAENHCVSNDSIFCVFYLKQNFIFSITLFIYFFLKIVRIYVLVGFWFVTSNSS